MKHLLLILGAGTAVFIVVAMTQEWDVFAAAWLGRGSGGAPPAVRRGAGMALTGAEQESAAKGAEAAVEAWLTMMRHLYAAAGDRRFSERAPASEEVVAAALADIAYLTHRGRRQVMELMRLERVGTEVTGRGRALVRTREYWVVRTQALDDRELEPARAAVVATEYRVEERNRVWTVVDSRRAR